MKREYKVLVGGELKTLDIESHFAYLKSLESRTDATGVFKSLAYIYRGVLLRSNAIAEIPYTILSGRKEIKWPDPLTRLFYTVEADLSIFGAAYALKQGTKSYPKLRRLNPSAMRVEADENGIKYFEFKGAKEVKKFNPKEIVYLHLYDPIQDLQPGISPTQVVLTAANLGINANEFATSFFKNYAIPAVILSVEGTVDEAETARVRDAWRNMFGGVKRAFEIMVLGHGTKVEKVGSPPKEVAMPELMGEIRKQVAVAFGIPEDMLTAEAANYATQQGHAIAFWQHTVIPEAKLIAEAFNEQLFSGLDLALQFDVEALPVMQEEETQRADALHSLVKSGLPLETALAVLGYDIPEGMDITPVAVPLMVTGHPRASEWKQEMKKWEKKALRRLEEDGNAMAPFTSPHFPWEIELGMLAKLARCRTPEQVKAAFRSSGKFYNIQEGWLHNWPDEIPKEEAD